MNAAEWGALDNSARDEIIDRAIIAQKGGLKSGGKFELPFGATEVFPRLKVSVARWQNFMALAQFLDCMRFWPFGLLDYGSATLRCTI